MTPHGYLSKKIKIGGESNEKKFNHVSHNVARF
jgi:hypothetical protein